MRKHNVKFARRVSRGKDNRSNSVQNLAHAMVSSKPFQLAANGLLPALFRKAGIIKSTKENLVHV